MKYLLLFSVILLVAVGLGVIGCGTESQPDRKPIRLTFGQKQGRPARDSLFAIYPNPFSSIAGDTNLAINFAMKDSGSAVVLIQNVIGDEVAGFSDSLLPSGSYSGRWNPIASDGTPLQAGLYFVTLRLDTYIQSRLVSIQNSD
jgi:hypothetical protein